MAAQMGLSPREFWAMTPLEFRLYTEGYGDRRDDEMDASAWAQANIMTAIQRTFGGSGSTSKGQIYRRKDAPPEFLSAEDFKAHMRQLAGEDDDED